VDSQSTVSTRAPTVTAPELTDPHLLSTPAVIVSHSPEASGNNVQPVIGRPTSLPRDSYITEVSGNNVQPVIGRPTSLPRVLDVNNNMAPAHLENTQLLAGGPY
jgi:hypothetical protein